MAPEKPQMGQVEKKWGCWKLEEDEVGEEDNLRV